MIVHVTLKFDAPMSPCGPDTWMNSYPKNVQTKFQSGILPVLRTIPHLLLIAISLPCSRHRLPVDVSWFHVSAKPRIQ